MKAVAIVIALAVLGARAEAKGCHEVSNVVGLQRCGWFGQWSRDADVPRLWLDVGYFQHRYVSQPFSLGTAALSTAGTDFTTESSGALLRLLGGIGPAFYTGVELEPGTISTVPSVPGPAPNGNTYFGIHAIAGVHASIFRLGLSTELAGGARWESFSICPTKTCTVTASQDRRELEVRLRADLFVTPRFSVGALVGKSLIDADDRTILIYAGLHLRAMDGMY